MLTKHLAAEDRALEQWLLVAIADDEKARDAVANAANAVEEVIEIVGNIPAASVAAWGLTDGEVRLFLPGEPISATANKPSLRTSSDYRRSAKAPCGLQADRQQVQTSLA